MILRSEATYSARARRLYKVLSDFEGLEALVRQYGADITHRVPGDPNGLGREWILSLGYKGVTRRVTAKVAELSPISGYLITAESDGVFVDLRLKITPLGDKETQVTYSAKFTGQGLGARFLLQSLRLAHASLQDKFDRRVVAFTRARLADARQQNQGKLGSRSS